ncbi:ABC transporter permease [Halobium palmae]|uniref:ABC transporter permease n=1 Tax=Halobium palmae TaxID=1776492 RepID=A0ABD5RZ00_9EURY
MSLGRFLVKRGLQGVFVVWGVVTVVFLLRFITPGDPISVIAPLDASQATREAIARELGLNQPLYVQYLDYLVELAQGNMGYSYISSMSASARVFARLPATLELAVAATVVAIVLSIPLGVLSATHRNEPVDYGATTFSLVGISTPNFWLGIMLVLLFAVEFELFRTSGRGISSGRAFALLLQGQPGGLIRWLTYITLPAITLGTYFTALVTRLTRSGMLDELGSQYVRATRAKGLPETLVRYRHALRNTLIPVLTVLGLQLGTLIGGAVITEAVFAWPGLGTLVINSITGRDWVVLQACLIVIGIGFVLINLFVDALYAYVDPRVVND